MITNILSIESILENATFLWMNKCSFHFLDEKIDLQQCFRSYLRTLNFCYLQNIGKCITAPFFLNGKSLFTIDSLVYLLNYLVTQMIELIRFHYGTYNPQAFVKSHTFFDY
jgi:hypothetical protein